MAKHKNIRLLALAVLACLFSGCTVSYRANSRFQEQAKPIRTIAILPSEVRVYKIDVNEVREEIAEWSVQARNNVVAAFENELHAKMKTVVKVVSEDSLAEKKQLLEDTRALYAAVSAMISLHTYPIPNFSSLRFDDKVRNFDYSLGTEVGSLGNGADALLFFYAEDHVWTAGRKRLQTLAIILGIGVGVATGVFIIPQLGGGTGMRAELIDGHTGDILWMNAVGSRTGKDLRDPASARAMVNELFKDFPVSYDH